MICFHLSQKITGNTASITEADQLHHLRDVLRVRAGDEITVFDAEGNKFLGIIEKLDRAQAMLKIKSRQPVFPRHVEITIACAVPKKSLMDEIIDKLTQLDVAAIIPLKTERIIVKLEGQEFDRSERWQKIARSAAEQSQRSTLPLIAPVTTLDDVLDHSNEYDLKLIPTLASGCRTIQSVLSESKPARILVLIGPEGDFTQSEVEKALKFGFIPISLGDTVLRVETAAIAVAAYLRLALQ